MKYPTFFLMLLALVWGCGSDHTQADAYGNFETTEVLVSAEAAGRLLRLDIEEGQTLTQGQAIGQIDSVQIYLKKPQLQAQMQGIRSRAASVLSQLEVLVTQEKNLLHEQKRVAALVADQAAGSKQLDDIQAQIDLVRKQMMGIRSQNQATLSELAVVEAQMAQIDDQLAKCRVTCPLQGTVLKKYAQAHELVAPGKALFKIAQLNEMELKAYIDGSKLSALRIGQPVEVQFDGPNGTMEHVQGTLRWVSSVAEFTPKIIQTRQERTHLVYALKVAVPNDGRIKIGMPGELFLDIQPKP